MLSVFPSWCWFCVCMSHSTVYGLFYQLSLCGLYICSRCVVFISVPVYCPYIYYKCVVRISVPTNFLWSVLYICSRERSVNLFLVSGLYISSHSVVCISVPGVWYIHLFPVCGLYIYISCVWSRHLFPVYGLNVCSLYVLCTLYNLQGNSHFCIPLLGIAQPQSQFPHSCVCEGFIYS